MSSRILMEKRCTATLIKKPNDLKSRRTKSKNAKTPLLKTSLIKSTSLNWAKNDPELGSK
jgi:hypothetical protein